MSDERDDAHGRLGRLFAALVNNEDDVDGPETPEEAATSDDTETSSLDVEALSRSLMGSPDPMGVLRGLVADVRARSEEGPGEKGAGSSPVPSPFELYLAMRLTEAGLLEDDVSLPMTSVVRPRTSDLFYLRVIDESLPWLAKLKILRIEAALNCALLVGRAIDDPNASTLEEIVRCEQRIERSIVSQAARCAERVDGPARGEWAVRRSISHAVECLQLPHRLTARFRTNVVGGRVAIEIDLVPPRAWPSSAYVEGLGIVPATTEMRCRAASDYNLRLGVLLAAYVFGVAPQVREVWVAGVVDGATGHHCYYSARLDRWALERLDLEGLVDPWAVMRDAGATIDESDRTLGPVRQGFTLDDELFCPARRYDPVELSEATLPPHAAAALGCHDIRDLGIDEACRRKLAARDLSRELGESTQKNVRALLGLTGEDAPSDVRDAALRCVRELIDGTIPDNPPDIVEALVSGDELSKAMARAEELLRAQDTAAARRCALDALAPLEERGAYVDADDVVWRSFGSYADRALYNRLLSASHEKTRLAPAPFLEAQLVASATALAEEAYDEAVSRATRARDMAPMSVQTSLHLAQCLEAAGRPEDAGDELRRMLSLAHDPESIGLTYLRMSQLQWRDGHVLAAQACYQRACRYLPTPTLVAGLAVVALLGQVGVASDGSLSDDAAESALRGEGIPLAPTHEVGEALLEATRAAVDAELFRVARDLMRSLTALFRDDVLFGVLRSIEGEPDR